MLLDLHAALTAEGGGKLAVPYQALLYRPGRQFRDTDLLQYQFSRQLRRHQLPVFLVGDPKQAIYSFRGADVYAYLKARRDAQQKYTLQQNWRSTAGLIEAVNALFKNATQPFMWADIPFEETALADTDPGELIIDDMDRAPLQIWFADAAADGKPCNKGEATQRAANATAGEIARLLNQGARGRQKSACQIVRSAAFGRWRYYSAGTYK